MSNTIKHFTHNHPLTAINGVGTYTCDGCKLDGEGKTYRCNDCDYDLHEFCATCPTSLRNSCHGPDHELSLYNGPTHMTERSCYVCRFFIQGMFYICKHCNFESHPLCTYVPMHASSLDATLTKQSSLHDHAGQPSSPHHYGQGNPYGYAIPYPYGGHPYQHQHQQPNMNMGSPKADPKHDSSTPHHYGQGNPYGYAIPYPYGSHPYQHQHQHQYQHLQANMNMGSPKADPKHDSSTPRKKKKGFIRAFNDAVRETAALATDLIVSTVTDSVMDKQ